jgi:HEPN domain-containing protein
MSDKYKEWIASSWEDFSVAEIEFKAEKYRHCIINCHHAMEKMAKAIYIKLNNKFPRKSHNIVEILREAYGELVYSQIVDEERQDFFADVTSYYPGINYPDSKLYSSLEQLTVEPVLKRTRSELEWLQSLMK